MLINVGILYVTVEEEGECGQGKLWIGLVSGVFTGVSSLPLLCITRCYSPIQGNGRLKVYDIESRCFESDIKITESKHGRSVRLVRNCSHT